MARTKGAKNRPRITEPMIDQVNMPEAAGNPLFNVADVEPTDVLSAASVMTDEDRAIDRELERMATEVPPMPVIDNGPEITVKPEKIVRELLSAHEDVSPAATVNELLDQVHRAKEAGCDSVEATPALVRHYCRKVYPSDVGYFVFHDIKVYIEGFFAEASKRDRRTLFDVESKLPLSKVDSKGM